MTVLSKLGALVRGKPLLIAALVTACGRAPTPTPNAPPPAAPSAPPAPVEAPAPAEPAAAPTLGNAERMEREEESKSPAQEGNFAQPPEKDDLQSAEAELERARADLNRALAARTPRPASAAGAPAAASRGTADAAPPAKAEKKSEESSCATACRAFGSLERAASAVCRITGEKDGRCSHAHAVVADAKKRVAVCTCTSE